MLSFPLLPRERGLGAYCTGSGNSWPREWPQGEERKTIPAKKDCLLIKEIRNVQTYDGRDLNRNELLGYLSTHRKDFSIARMLKLRKI